MGPTSGESDEDSDGSSTTSDDADEGSDKSSASGHEVDKEGSEMDVDLDREGTDGSLPEYRELEGPPATNGVAGVSGVDITATDAGDQQRQQTPGPKPLEVLKTDAVLRRSGRIQAESYRTRSSMEGWAYFY